MKKIYILKTLISIFLAVAIQQSEAQQFEWARSIIPNSEVKGGVFSMLSKVAYPSNDNVLIISKTRSMNEKIMQTSEEILNSKLHYSNYYFAVFDKSGKFVKSQIINNPASVTYLNTITGYSYDPNTKRSYLSVTAGSDSITFGTDEPWVILDGSRSNCFIAIYDENYDYLRNVAFTSSYKGRGGVNLVQIFNDNSGNVYCQVLFKDTLFVDGAFLYETNSEIGTQVLIKFNSNFEKQWEIKNSSFSYYLEYSSNKDLIYTAIYNVRTDTIHYSDKDTVINSPVSGNSFCIASVSPNTGHFINFFEVNRQQNYSVIPTQIKAFDTTLLINAYASYPNEEISLKINNKNYSFPNTNKTGNNNLIFNINADNFEVRFINLFDSTSGDIYITDIYNDSLYSVVGVSRGNCNFGFNGKNEFANDYLKNRDTEVESAFLATYTVRNRLKDLWFFENVVKNQSGSGFSFIKAEIIDKDIYITGSVMYPVHLGLGSAVANLNPGLHNTSLIKYNCLPSAYFRASDFEVNFKNTSSGDCQYKWDFGDNSAPSFEKNPMHKYNRTGFDTVKLFVNNDCGTDSFERKINISDISVSSIDNDLEFGLFPNPAQSELFINIKSGFTNNEYLEFIVNDIKGQKISTKAYKIDESSYKLETSNLANGVYLLTVVSDGYSKTMKFIVNK